MAIYTMLHPCVTEQLECLLALQMGGKMVREGDLLKIRTAVFHQIFITKFMKIIL